MQRELWRDGKTWSPPLTCQDRETHSSPPTSWNSETKPSRRTSQDKETRSSANLGLFNTYNIFEVVLIKKKSHVLHAMKAWIMFFIDNDAMGWARDNGTKNLRTMLRLINHLDRFDPWRNTVSWNTAGKFSVRLPSQVFAIWMTRKGDTAFLPKFRAWKSRNW